MTITDGFLSTFE
jgi:hypothetical protein